MICPEAGAQARSLLMQGAFVARLPALAGAFALVAALFFISAAGVYAAPLQPEMVAGSIPHVADDAALGGAYLAAAQNTLPLASPAGVGQKQQKTSALERMLGLESGAAESDVLDLTMPMPPHEVLQGTQVLPPPQPTDDSRDQAPPAARTSGELALQKRGIVPVELRPGHPFVISAPFGATLISINVKDGESVEEGAVLAQFDTAQSMREMEEARLAMEEAVARVQNAQNAPEREQVASREHLGRMADLLREAEERLEKTALVSPAQGRVIEIRAKAGQTLRRGDTVMELARPDDLEAVSTIPSSWVAHLKPGHIVWVFIEETGKSYEAEFVRFGGKVNAVTRTIRAYARLRGELAALLPGMSGRANFFPQAGNRP